MKKNVKSCQLYVLFIRQAQFSFRYPPSLSCRENKKAADTKFCKFVAYDICIYLWNWHAYSASELKQQSSEWCCFINIEAIKKTLVNRKIRGGVKLVVI